MSKNQSMQVFHLRGEKVRTLLQTVPGADALFFSDLNDIRWLTGFSGSFGWLVVSDTSMTLLTDGRYSMQARQQLQQCGVKGVVIEAQSQSLMQSELLKVLETFQRIWFQADQLTVHLHQLLKEKIKGEFLPAPAPVAELRRLKDAGEISLIESACLIADEALKRVTPMLCERPTERDIRDELEYTMRRLGADGPSYETIVATGPINAAQPHHRPTSTIIEEGHTVIIDVGALVGGYHSDMTRSFIVGAMTKEQEHAYQAVLAAQAAGVMLVGPGVPAMQVDAVCRKVLAQAGLSDLFTHGTGHGVGLVIHEEPYLNRTSSAILQVGDVVTVEPGVYRRGFGGLRVEDLLIVTPTANKIFNTSSKDPTCPLSPPMT